MQYGSGGKDTTLGSDSIGNCELKVHMNMSLILNVYRDWVVWIYKCKSIVKGNKEIEITYR